MRLSSSFISF